MATAELTWTEAGKSHADLDLTYDPASVNANGQVVVTAASGTYQTLDANGNVVDTDQVTGLIAPNSFLFAPDDQLDFSGKNPIVDTAGVGVIINNAADADQIGPNNTPEVIFSTDIFGDYEEFGKNQSYAVDVGLSGGPSSGGGTTGGGGSTGGGGGGGGNSGGGGTPPTGDTVTFDQNAAFFGDGTFVLSGKATAAAGVKSIDVTADVDGTVTDIGQANLNADGTFAIVDRLGRHSEGFITATETDNAGGTASGQAPYALAVNKNGSANQDTFSTDGSTVLWTANLTTQGARNVSVLQPHQTIDSQFVDVFRNQHQQDTTFVFTPGYADDTVAGFVVSGSGHDTLSLASSDFSSFAQVLHETQQTSAGAVIHDHVSGDTITLSGINKTDLAQHKADVSFHA